MATRRHLRCLGIRLELNHREYRGPLWAAATDEQGATFQFTLR